MSFWVGQKVATICEWIPRSHVPQLPQMGAVYRIRAILGPGILLEEIVNPVIIFFDGVVGEPRFNIEFFRPIVERKIDIGIFVRMLTPAREDA